MTISPTRICYLANAASVHTTKWALHFARRGYEVHIASMHPPHAELTGVRVHYLWAKRRTRSPDPRWRYFLAVGATRALVSRLRPHILHAHYATGYGLLGSLTGFHPFVISVWGSDILDFPKRSPLHKVLVTFNLGRADYVCSTSRHMARLTREYTTKEVTWTPFGVDCARFTPDGAENPRDDATVTIGTVRALEEGYGIEYLISAFAALRRRAGTLSLRLLIVGDGPERRRFERMAEALGIRSVTEFVGHVPHDQVPAHLRRMDVFVAPSVHEEGFGVAVLEASACGLPVVASNVGGLPEAVEDRMTGLLVPPGDSATLAEALESLVRSQTLRKEMGGRGRRFVRDRYAWPVTALAMERLYQRIVAGPSVRGG